jgi:hypothetical protein
MFPFSSTVVARAGSGQKKPAAAFAGADRALALAAFLKRPQAEAQIGATGKT